MDILKHPKNIVDAALSKTYFPTCNLDSEVKNIIRKGEGWVNTRFQVQYNYIQYNQYFHNFSYLVYWFHGPFNKLKNSKKWDTRKTLVILYKLKKWETSLSLMCKSIYFLLIHHLSREAKNAKISFYFWLIST